MPIAQHEADSRKWVEPVGGQGCVRSLFFLGHLFSPEACDLVFLWPDTSSGNIEQKAFHPLLLNMFFPEPPRRLCWVSRAAEFESAT